MTQRIPISREGLDELTKGLAKLEKRRDALQREVGEAAEKGDLSENAEFIAAKESLSFVNSKINELQAKISRADIINTTHAPVGTVVFGSTVNIYEHNAGQDITYQLVGEGEADFTQNKILTSSPIGRALLQKKVGDIVEVTIPKGTLKIEIKSIGT